MRLIDRRTFLLGLAGLSLVPFAQRPAQAYQPFEPFTFAYVTDVHLTNSMPDSYKLLQESQLFLQQLIKELNGETLDFVVFGGDQVETIGRDQANWQLFLDIVQGLQAPWSFVLGEQDISGAFAVDKFRTFGPDWKSLGIETENAYWSHTLSRNPGVHLVGLDTSLPNQTCGGVSPKQLEWLRNDLTNNKRLFTIVFSHHPLLPPPPFDGGLPFEEYVIPDGGAVREVLGAFNNVRLVLNGHVHVSKVQQERDIWYVSNPSLDVYPCGYRIFRVTPDAVTMETYQIDFPALIKKARRELAASNFADKYNRADPNAFVRLVEGNKLDQDALIPFIAGKTLAAIPKKKRPAEKSEKAEKVEKAEKAEKSEKAEKPEKPRKQKRNDDSSAPREKKSSGLNPWEALYGKKKPKPTPAEAPPALNKLPPLPVTKPTPD